MGKRDLNLPVNPDSIYLGADFWQEILNDVDKDPKSFLQVRNKKGKYNKDTTNLKIMYLTPFDNGYGGAVGGALVSNAMFEGGMDPLQKQVGDGPGRGPFQMETGVNSRGVLKEKKHWDNYNEVVKKDSYYKPGNPIANQSLYVIKSLEGDPTVGEFKATVSPGDQYKQIRNKYGWTGNYATSKMRKALKLTTSPRLASDAIISAFEKPKTSNANARADLAEKIYNKLEPQVRAKLVKKIAHQDNTKNK